MADEYSLELKEVNNEHGFKVVFPACYASVDAAAAVGAPYVEVVTREKIYLMYPSTIWGRFQHTRKNDFEDKKVALKHARRVVRAQIQANHKDFEAALRRMNL